MASTAELTAEVPVRRPALIHVCFAATGNAEGAAADYLRGLWSGYDAIEMTAPIPSLAVPTSFPAGSFGEVGMSAAVLAAKQRHAPGASYQAFLIAYHDTIALIASLAPNRESDALDAWEKLARERDSAAATGPLEGALGEALIFLALSPRSTPWSTEAIGDAVVAELARAAGGPPVGQLVFEHPDSLAVWELDAVPRRVLGLVAPEEHESELYSWAWWGPGAQVEQLPPLARTLLHSAKLRYEVALLQRELPRIRASGTDIDRVAGALKALPGRIDPEKPIPSQVLAQAQERVIETRLRTSELLRLTTGLVDLRQTIVIARRNLERLGPQPGTPGRRALFDEEIQRAEWAGEQIGHELAYTEGVIRRAEEMHAVSDLLLRREAERHAGVRNDLALIQTSLLAALLAGLGAIQTLGGHAEVSEGLRAPLIALILAVVFALPLVFTRWYERLRLIDHLAAAMLAGSVAWVAMAFALSDSWLALEGENEGFVLQVLAVVAGAIGALTFTRWIGKRRAAQSLVTDPEEVRGR